MIGITVASVKEQYHTVGHRDGKKYTFFVDRMVALAKKRGLPTTNCEFPQEVIDFILKADTVEEQYLAKVDPNDDRPGIVVVWLPGDGHSLVDGNHRLIRKYREGVTNMECWVWPYEAWQMFCLVTDKTPTSVELIAFIAVLENVGL